MVFFEQRLTVRPVPLFSGAVSRLWIEYLRAAGQASRAETFQLVFFLACVVSLASLYEVEKLLGLIERMIGVLEKLTK